jgi:hypothetical protein
MRLFGLTDTQFGLSAHTVTERPQQPRKLCQFARVVRRNDQIATHDAALSIVLSHPLRGETECLFL